MSPALARGYHTEWAIDDIILQTHTFISAQVFFSRIQAHSISLYLRVIPNTALEKKIVQTLKKDIPRPRVLEFLCVRFSVPNKRQLLLTPLCLRPRTCGPTLTCWSNEWPLTAQMQ